MSRSDSDFERSNVSLKENKPNDVDLNSNDLDYCVRKSEEKSPWFTAECTIRHYTHRTDTNKFWVFLVI